MPGFLFILGTIASDGVLVALIMALLTASVMDSRREDESRTRLATLEAEEERLRKAA